METVKIEQVKIFHESKSTIQEPINSWLLEKGNTILITRVKQDNDLEHHPSLIITIFYSINHIY